MPIDPVARAVTAYRLILDKASSIVFTPPAVISKTGSAAAVPLSPQTVRINSDNRATVIGGASGVAPKRAVIVYGLVGHPDPSVADNDIKVGYTFPYAGETYRVYDIIPGTPGEIQAQATSAGGATS